MLSSLRTLHAVPLKNVRSAIAYLRDTVGREHPLADCDLLTDRSDLFIEQTGEYLNIRRAGQLEMNAQLLQCMRQVDRLHRYNLLNLTLTFRSACTRIYDGSS